MLYSTAYRSEGVHLPSPAYCGAYKMTTEQIELFERFVASISSPNSTLPRETTLGAITHFLSTLPLEHCTRLIRACSSSTILWTSTADTASTRTAIRLGVVGAAARLSREAVESKRWYSVKIGRSFGADSWVQGMLDEAKMSDRKADLLVALLSGIHAQVEQRGSQAAVSKGLMRELQEETVLALAPALVSRADPENIHAYTLLSEVMDGMEEQLLHLLDLPVRLPVLHTYGSEAYRHIDKHGLTSRP